MVPLLKLGLTLVSLIIVELIAVVESNTTMVSFLAINYGTIIIPDVSVVGKTKIVKIFNSNSDCYLGKM